MRVLAIIQARMTSTRLPGKALMRFSGQSMLEHVVDRVAKSKLVDEVLVATTINRSDLPIVAICAKKGIRVFCGAEDDVLDRFYQAAKIIKPKQILRITADCPVIDPEIIDQVIAKHLRTHSDYTANTVGAETFPDGQDAEIFTLKALEKSWQKARLASEREHVTQFIKKNPKIFKISSITSREDLSSYRWTVDDADDFQLIKEINAALYKKNHFFSMQDIFKFLKQNPKLNKINSHIGRNEGLKKSLAKDKIIKRTEG
ncbi:MAG: glycosyltransferase family protein [bacterium]